MQSKVLGAIPAKVTRRFLTGVGYNPNVSRVVVYAPKQLGGMCMQNLYTPQGVMNVTQILKHMRADFTLGELFMWTGSRSGLVSG